MADGIDERSYLEGQRGVWISLLGNAIDKLTVHDKQDQDAEKARWLLERESVRRFLRTTCAEYGDNDWSDDLFLEDVIEKHLLKHLLKDK